MHLPQRDEIMQMMELLGTRYLQGKQQSVRLSVTALLAGGHLLLEDIPGLGKTTLALALSGILSLSFGRIQCTSDLLPSDITGLSVFNREENRFVFVRGPVFNNILLVDEINRAMPRTQSALLEAMEERRVTVEGVTYPLPEPFMVIATQNPLEQVGTYPLPESQLDRFLLRTGIGYPSEAVETSIIRAGSIRDEIRGITPVIGVHELQEAQRTVREQIYLSEKVAGYIYRIIAGSRSAPFIASGISSRGGICMADAAKANAYLEGRDYVIPEDVQTVALSVGAHRLILAHEQESLNKEDVLRTVLEHIPVPLA